jgi:hypothetical protein
MKRARRAATALTGIGRVPHEEDVLGIWQGSGAVLHSGDQVVVEGRGAGLAQCALIEE